MRYIKANVIPSNILNLPTLGDATGGVICSFRTDLTNALNKLKIAFSASQDLHGYSKPWIGGVGKNKINLTFNNTQSFIYTDFTPIAGKNYIVSVFDVKGTTTGISRGSTYAAQFRDSSNNIIVNNLHRGATITAEEVSQITRVAINFSNSYYTGTETQLVVQLEESLTPTSYEPYENICPITGFSQANVFRMGKNLWEYGNQTATRKTEINNVTSIKAGSYTLSANVTTQAVSNPRVSFFYPDNTSTVVTIASGTRSNATFTLTKAPSKIEFWAGSSASDSNDKEFSFTDIQLEVGSTATNFVPYHGNTYLLQFGDTYYGCEIDVVHGKLRVLWAKLVFDGNTLENEIGVSVLTNYTQVSSAVYQSVGKGNETFKCDKFEFNQAKGLYRIWNNNSTTSIRMFMGLPTTVTTKAEAVAWFANNPTEVVYELAEPIEVDIDSAIITALTGEVNQVYCDIPTSEVEELQFFETVGRHIQ